MGHEAYPGDERFLARIPVEAVAPPSKDTDKVSRAKPPIGRVHLMGDPESFESQPKVDEHLFQSAGSGPAPDEAPDRWPQPAVAGEPAVGLGLGTVDDTDASHGVG
jgi:hypothetical protein